MEEEFFLTGPPTRLFTLDQRERFKAPAASVPSSNAASRSRRRGSGPGQPQGSDTSSPPSAQNLRSAVAPPAPARDHGIIDSSD